jgi:uncharacterized membrane protein YdfJ with MMPL/SSD domain
MDRDAVIEMILDPGRQPAVGSPEHQAFLAYLEQSPECRAMYEQQQAVWETLDLWEPAEPSAGFDRELYRKIDQSARNELAGFWAWLRRPSEWLAAIRPSLAAAMAALLLIAGTIVTYQPRRGAEPVAAQLPAEIGPEYVEQMDQALDDIEMLADFEALVLGAEGPGKS